MGIVSFSDSLFAGLRSFGNGLIVFVPAAGNTFPDIRVYIGSFDVYVGYILAFIRDSGLLGVFFKAFPFDIRY